MKGMSFSDARRSTLEKAWPEVISRARTPAKISFDQCVSREIVWPGTKRRASRMEGSLGRWSEMRLVEVDRGKVMIRLPEGFQWVPIVRSPLAVHSQAFG